MARVLITGANRGIGLELVRQLGARGDEVIAVCRTGSAGLRDTGARVISGIDVSREDCCRRLAAELQGDKLDWLVNNAGILAVDSLDDLDFASIENQFRVNAMGPLRVTAALRGCLRRGSKVFVISSRMGSIEDNTSGGYYGYRMSKVAVNMAAKSLSVDLKPFGVGVYVLHPGFVATDMTGHQGATPVEEAVRGLIARMDELGPESTAAFRHAQGENLPW